MIDRGGGREQPRLNCTSFPMKKMREKIRDGKGRSTGVVCDFFAVTNLLFRFAHHCRCLIGIDLTFAVLLRTFARVTERTYRKL